eukprot:7568765-Pyramimonas_sp.AAC.1
MKAHGWLLAISPSVVTDQGGLSAGVGIAVRKHIGMGKAPNLVNALPSPHRVLATHINSFVPGGFIA